MAASGSEDVPVTAAGRVCLGPTCDCLPGITAQFLPKELILGIPALCAEKFAYFEIRMQMEFLRGLD